MQRLVAKLVFLVAGLTLMGGLLMGLRQQRLRLGHEQVMRYGALDRTREDLWRAQTKLTRQTHPQRLREGVEAAGLELVPLTPERGSPMPARALSGPLSQRPSGAAD